MCQESVNIIHLFDYYFAIYLTIYELSLRKSEANEAIFLKHIFFYGLKFASGQKTLLTMTDD